MLTSTKWLNPWLRRPLGGLLLLLYAFRVLFGTLTGVLILSLALYFLTPRLSSVEPFSPSQLALWFDDLGVEAKMGLATSLITVLGFLIALRTTMYSWQKQTATSLRISAVESIDRVVTEVSSAVLRIQIFGEQIQKHGPRREADSGTLAIRIIPPSLGEMAAQFVIDRQRMLVLQQEVLALPARYSIIFLPVPKLDQSVEAIGAHVGEVCEHMWHVLHVLPPPGQEPRSFGYANEEGLGKLVTASEVAHSELLALLGALRGALLTPIVELNGAAVLKMSRVLFGKLDD